METVTKKEIIDRIADSQRLKRSEVKQVVQSFLDGVISELGEGNRLEFRDFGVFELQQRKGRLARNPQTSDPVSVPPKQTVKFKMGRMMEQTVRHTEHTKHTKHTNGNGHALLNGEAHLNGHGKINGSVS